VARFEIAFQYSYSKLSTDPIAFTYNRLSITSSGVSTYIPVYDDEGCVAGMIYMDPLLMSQSVDNKHDFMALSRTTLFSNCFNPSYDATSSSFRDRPPEGPLSLPCPLSPPSTPSPPTTQPPEPYLPPHDPFFDLLTWTSRHREGYTDGFKTLNSLKKCEVHNDRHEWPDYHWFDQDKYDAGKVWPLYNVLAVEWVGGVAYRRGVGKVHVDAFDGAGEGRGGGLCWGRWVGGLRYCIVLY
jgi:hypothetical protein